MRKTTRLNASRHGVMIACCLALAGCAFPNKDRAGLPGPDVINVTQDSTGFRAVAPDCATLLEPSQLDKHDDRRPAIAFGCATYGNLANQLARPTDLTHPKAYRGQSADTAASAVQRYREGKVTELRGTSTTDVGAD